MNKVYTKQVDKKHYNFAGYFHKFRWMSYWYQTTEIVSRDDIKTCLDIGPGNQFLKKMLEMHRPDIEYKTFDIDKDLEPDYIGSVTDIRLPDNSFDAVCAFQVLEHIEFKDFVPALKELKRVSKKYVFVSLPHNVPSFDLDFKLPGLKRVRFAIKIPWGVKHVFEGQHYWEVGKAGYSSKKVHKIIADHFEIINDYVPHENQYHHFYILKVA